MRPQAFKLERFFAEHEFSTPHLLCCSDCEPLHMSELLNAASDELGALWESLSLGYTESQGHLLLRQRIAALCNGASVDDVLVLAPEEGIFCAMNALLSAGDHVVTTFPGYQSLHEIARSLGCRVSRWSPRIEGDSWVFDVGDLLSQIESATRMVVINFPHNPTGTTIGRDALEAILARAERDGFWVFSDEMYRMLELDRADRLPSAASLSARAVSLSGLSKAYALPGLRIGWVIARDTQAMQQLRRYRDYTTICNSAPSEILALMALAKGEEIIARNLEIIAANAAAFGRFAATHSETLQWLPPKAGSVAFPRLLADNADAFCDALRREEGVLLAPSSLFDVADQHVRLGLGRKGFELGLERLDSFLERRRGR